jgi:hypothetical protein
MTTASTPPAKREWIRFDGVWLHRHCVETWEEMGEEIRSYRMEEARYQRNVRFLFQDESLLTLHRGVLVRVSQLEEHRLGGLLDDGYAGIGADLANERVESLIDAMSEEERAHLVAAAFKENVPDHRYLVLLGWAGSVPEKYDRKLIGDVQCYSFVVRDLPKRLREKLSPSLAARL